MASVILQFTALRGVERGRLVHSRGRFGFDQSSERRFVAFRFLSRLLDLAPCALPFAAQAIHLLRRGRHPLLELRDLRLQLLAFRLQRSEEHTSELQSHLNLVCRLLLQKKQQYWHPSHHTPTTPPIP